MILVTGGTGLVGTHLLCKLLANNEPVRVLVRENSNKKLILNTLLLNSNNGSDLFSKINWVYGDVNNYYSLLEATEGVEKVYHAAAYVSFNNSDRQKVLSINITGTANIVNACLENNVRKICHVSSIAALGKAIGNLPVNEQNIWMPSKLNSAYTISKFHSEMEVWRGIEEGLEGVIVNPSVILGYGNWDKSSNALFKTIAHGLKFYAPGSSGFIDVHDVTNAMILLMESNITGQRYVLNAYNTSYKQLFEQIAIAFNVTIPNIKVKRWMGALAWRFEYARCLLWGSKPQVTKETIRSGFNNTSYSANKFITAFNYTFIPFNETIEKTVKQYKLRQY